MVFDEYMSKLVDNLGEGWIVTGNKNEYLVSHIRSITIATILHKDGIVEIKRNRLLGEGLGKKLSPTQGADLLKTWLRK